MSANRSVQAAQRRRAIPTSESAIPGRTPQPSINSSQMFANQARSSNPPNSKQQQASSKMTIAQAITLITLRLGAVETKLINLDNEPTTQGLFVEGQENMVLIDQNVIQSIVSRLDSLEKRSSPSSTSSSSLSTSGPEIALLKQSFETVKQAVIQNKGLVTTVSKENKELKTKIETLKAELLETKELINVLQNLTMDNSQKLMEFSVNFVGTSEQLFNEVTEVEDSEVFYEEDNTEFIGTNLKELIESEINADL